MLSGPSAAESYQALICMLVTISIFFSFHFYFLFFPFFVFFPTTRALIIFFFCRLRSRPVFVGVSSILFLFIFFFPPLPPVVGRPGVSRRERGGVL